MKVKASVPIELRDASDCARAAKEVTEMRCGLAFAIFNLRDDRIDKTKPKPISMENVRGGLLTTGRDSRLQFHIGDPLKKELSPIASAARRIANRLDKEKKAVTPKEAPALLAEIEKVDAKLKEVWNKVDQSCQGLGKKK